MTNTSSQSMSAKLIELTSELHALDRNLKSGITPEGPELREFRQALDNVRMTAWTTNELMDARHAKRDSHAVLSFLAGERLRRFGQMVKDLCSDLNAEGIGSHTHGVQALSEPLKVLQDRLAKLAGQRK